MENVETFRKETRAWLEANCPPEMHRPTQTEEDTCWGGRLITSGIFRVSSNNFHPHDEATLPQLATPTRASCALS
jgi:hypothetical protein